jgi:hypothetical protein
MNILETVMQNDHDFAAEAILVNGSRQSTRVSEIANRLRRTKALNSFFRRNDFRFGHRRGLPPSLSSGMAMLRAWAVPVGGPGMTICGHVTKYRYHARLPAEVVSIGVLTSRRLAALPPKRLRLTGGRASMCIEGIVRPVAVRLSAALQK